MFQYNKTGLVINLNLMICCEGKCWFLLLWASTRGCYLIQKLIARIQRNIGQLKADLLCSGSKNHDPEDKEHTEPDLSNDSGVGLDLVQQSGQKTPLSHALRSDQEKQKCLLIGSRLL